MPAPQSLATDPLLVQIADCTVEAAFPGRRGGQILEAIAAPKAFEAMRFRSFMDLLARERPSPLSPRSPA